VTLHLGCQHGVFEHVGRYDGNSAGSDAGDDGVIRTEIEESLRRCARLRQPFDQTTPV